MQTFLCYPSDFVLTAKTLDNKRLSKQLTEAYQIINILHEKFLGYSPAWSSHPAVRMWEGYVNCLKYYYNCILDEINSRKQEGIIKSQKSRGKMYNDILTMNGHLVQVPNWLNNPLIKISHQSNLAHKKPNHYTNFTNHGIIGYYWPVPVYTKNTKKSKQQWVQKFKDKIPELDSYFKDEMFKSYVNIK